MCVARLPAKDDAPLVVDPDRVVFLQIPPEFLEAVGGWNHQVLQSRGRMQHTAYRDAVKWGESAKIDGSGRGEIPLDRGG